MLKCISSPSKVCESVRKLQDITRDEAIQFARDNGICRPDAIIRDVVASLKQFRTIATQYGVSEQWTGRIETTIIDHLKAWGEWTEQREQNRTRSGFVESRRTKTEGQWKENAATLEQIINGHTISNIRIGQAYKGNFHLLGTIDGQERQFVIGKNKEEYALIEKTGIANLTDEQLKSVVEKYFKL